MREQQANNPLHGVVLKQIVNSLVEHYGWDELGKRINIRCFISNPSLKSSLKFLRKTPWARKKVEDLYINTQQSVWKCSHVFSQKYHAPTTDKQKS
ncbi:VF530 family protein [Desulfobacula toluolica]|uniref:VF530 family protein n=1 Tax=Desulfobacula toluolica TaxID=28223 RepID=UPI000A078D7C|nr:VF530 family protein [Desulfobacula toluolica]